MTNDFNETQPTPVSNSLADTAPQSIVSTPQDNTRGLSEGSAPEKASPPKKMPRGLIFGIGLLVLLLVAGFSGYGGYQSGIQQRLVAQATQISTQLDDQYQLGLQDLTAGRYDIARQRFEFILQNRPDYPGVTDSLAEALLGLERAAYTPTPTMTPTPAPTATPDLRSQQELFENAQKALAAQDWSNAIDNLLRLRKADPNYNAVRIDGMLYIALRNRGVEKILKLGDLEGGTYDLAQAEKIGPLDVEAKNYRVWVDLYAKGASFWELDWQQAINYFQQLAQIAPGLRDSSNWTALQRYQVALTRYAEQLANSGDWCAAYEQYIAAINAGASVGDAANTAASNCAPEPEETTAPTQEPGATPPGDSPTPTPPPAEPTAEPTAYP